VAALAAGTGAWILTTRSISVDIEIQAQLDLRPFAIMRRDTETAARPPLQLPRERVLLTLLLPTARVRVVAAATRRRATLGA
jgi:hypothetical protein